MRYFKPGEWVRCVDATLTAQDPLVEGRLYHVEGATQCDSGEYLLHLEGMRIARNSERFEPAELTNPPSYSHWGMVLAQREAL